MKCPNCGKQVKSGAKFCQYCGYPLQKNTKNDAQIPRPKRSHLSKQKVWLIVGAVIVILLIGGSFWGKEYFTPARALSRQLPKSTWIESHKARIEFHHGKKGHKDKRHKKQVHHRLVVSNGSQLLSFHENRKSTKIFKALSNNSAKARQLKTNLSHNMKNTIIQSNFTYRIKNDSFHFKNGIVYKDIQKNKHGFTFKCYKGKKFLRKEHLKIYHSLPSPIK